MGSVRPSDAGRNASAFVHFSYNWYASRKGRVGQRGGFIRRGVFTLASTSAVILPFLVPTCANVLIRGKQKANVRSQTGQTQTRQTGDPVPPISRTAALDRK